MSDTLRAAAQQALEAFDPKNGQPNDLWPFHVKALQSRACKALRAALAEHDVPETNFGNMLERLRTYSADPELSDRYSDAMQEAADEIERLGAALAAAVAEPVAWIVEDDRGERLEWAADVPHCFARPSEPLYAAPPQREPLTDEQVFSSEDFMTANGLYWGLPMTMIIQIVRCTERAHGISAPASAPKEQA